MPASPSLLGHRAEYRESLRTVAIAGWPESKGIIWGAEAIRVPLDKLLDKVRGLPFTVIEYEPSGPAIGSPPATRIEQGTLWFYRVNDPDEGEGMGIFALDAALERLAEYLSPRGEAKGRFPGWQVRAEPLITDSLNLPLNQYWLGTQRPFLLGAVVCTVWTGRTP